MDVFVGPVHFRHVNQTFNTLFQLSKATVVSQVSDDCVYLHAFWVTLFNVDPRIFAQLLQTQ